MFYFFFFFSWDILSLWRERIDFQAECYQEYYCFYKHIQSILKCNFKTSLSYLSQVCKQRSGLVKS